MVVGMDTDVPPLVMVTVMKENTNLIKDMVKALTSGMMEESMMVSSWKTRGMEKGNSHGPMEQCMLVIL
jgi:hypoxanthine-guanine phosphoribosyltransferase